MTLADIFIDIQSSPNFRRNLIIVLICVLGLAGVAFGVWNNVRNTNSKQNLISQNITNLDNLGKRFSAQFPEGIAVKPVTQNVALNSSSFIINSKGEPVYTSEDRTLFIGTNQVKEIQTQIPLNIQTSKLGYFLNDYLNGSLVAFDQNSYKIKPNPSGVNQIVPLNTGVDDFGFTNLEEFYFLKPENGNYIFQKSSNINLQSVIKIGEIKSPLVSSGFYEMFKVKNGILIGLFENPAQQGKAEFWLYKNANLKQIVKTENVWSVLAQENYLIITYKELYSNLVSNYKNDIYDLSQADPKLVNFPLAFEVRKLGIFGNVLARRCAISPTNIIYCLVKEKPVKTDNFTEPDLIIEINPAKPQVTILGQNIAVTASNSIIGDWNKGKLLLSNTKDGLIYETNLNK